MGTYLRCAAAEERVRLFWDDEFASAWAKAKAKDRCSPFSPLRIWDTLSFSARVHAVAVVRPTLPGHKYYCSMIDFQ